MGCLGQFYALNSKNFILRLRHPWRTLFEIVILPTFIGLLLGYSTKFNLKIDVQDVTVIASQLLSIYLTNTVLTPIFFASPCVFLINQLVADKETKMRETMKIMSLNQMAYSFSYYVSQLFLTLLMSVILFLAIWLPINSLEGQNISVLIFIGSWYHMLCGTLLFGMALQSMSMALSSMFTDSKLSAQVGPLLLLFPSSLSMVFIIKAIADRFTAVVIDHSKIAPANNLQWGYFIPHFPYSVILLDFFFKDGAKLFLGLNITYAYFALIANVVGWYILYEYLDAVIPNAFGIR